MIFPPWENDGESSSGVLAPPGPANRGIRLVLFTILILVTALALWRLREIVLVCFGAVVGAIILRSLAAPLSRRFKLPEAVALSVIVLLLGISFGGFFWFFGNQTATEVGQFQQLLPTSLERLKATLDGSAAGRAFMEALNHSTADTRILSGMGSLAGSLLEIVTEISLIIFLSIYFAFSPKVYINGLVRIAPRRHRQQFHQALLDTAVDLRKWLTAQLYSMLIIGFLVGISSALLKIPLSLLLGVFACFLEFIPAVGPVIFTIPAVLIAFTKGPGSVLSVLIVYFAVQQLESNIIMPLLQQRAVKVPPAVILLAVVIGGLLLGPLGVVFGIPMTVALISLGKRLL